MNISSKVFSFILSASLASSAISVTAANDSQVKPATGSASAAASTAKLSDGLYLVLREADSATKVEPASQSEHALIYDYHFLEPAEREKPNYLILSTDAFIPFVLSNAPTMDEDSHGKPKLMLQLAQKQVVPLAEFTRKNLGKTVAIVVDGQVVSAHKIKEPIIGGRLQISWCTRNGCHVLMSKLQSDSTKVAQ
jgi:preprotein translocase subunit SecD